MINNIVTMMLFFILVELIALRRDINKVFQSVSKDSVIVCTLRKLKKKKLKPLKNKEKVVK